MFVKKVAYYIVPRLMVKSKNPNIASRNPELSKSQKNDIYYNTEGVRPGTAGEVLKKMDKVQSEFIKFSLPFIVYQGANDKVTDFEGFIYNLGVYQMWQ